MSRDDLMNDILEAEEGSLPSSTATDLADHSRNIGGVLVEQAVSGHTPLPDYSLREQDIIHDSLPHINTQHADATTRLLGDSDIQLEFTFWYMKKRQWSRLQRGTFTNEKRGFSLWWFLFYISFYSAYLTLQIEYFKRTRGFWLEYILMANVSITLAMLSPRFGWFVRCIFLEIYGSLFIFFVDNFYYKTSYYIILASGLCAVVVFTVICFFIYPYLLRCYLSCTGAITMKFNPSGIKGEANRYVIKQKDCFRTAHQCVYEGPMKHGKPHGIGTWMDTSYQGELLTGYWEQGIPVGPFESMENDTRSLLVNLRIIFGTNGGGKWWLDRTPLNMGVASVECCVSGNFFKGYPKVFMIKGPDECVCTHHNECTCIRNLLQARYYKHAEDEKHLKSVVVSIDRKHGSLAISGHRPKRNREKRVTIDLIPDGHESQRSYQLQLDQEWISNDQREGVLFIHGFDHDLKDTIKRFGQFLALGHFPKHLLPFVFNWPSSTNGLLYWCAHNVASDTDNHRDLKRFLQSLRASGIRHLHILCHSMGTRFFLRSFLAVKKIFNKRFRNDSVKDLATSHEFGQQDADTTKIHLANLILMNPDYEIETFKNDYAELRMYCSRITIYADHRDDAIRLAHRLNQKSSLGNNVLPLLDSKGGFLDIDIIDTGDLDSNMSERHHSFFNINRLMVDDLYDLIVTGKRAEERTSRLKATGRVYRFTILPSSVVMV
eukprot:Phypoly_transcript_01976.p1 GENE.Phypoly_transcript_01976~~Phypoly_transcript_01976.p1  ORF type:complete len:717 (+),score=63.12 Phypoly_transcript_01976:122-2272(+)